MTTPERVFVGFPAPEALRDGLRDYIHNHALWPTDQARRALRDVTECLARTLLDQFFLTPAREIGLGDSKMRWVELGVDTLERGVVLMIRRTSRNMNARQLAAGAAQLEPLLRPLPEEDGELHVAFRVPRELYRRARAGLDDIHAGNVLENRAHMAEMLGEMTRHFNRLFFDEPLRHLQLGPVAGRLVKLTRDGSEAAVIRLIQRVIKRLDREQTLAAAAYMESMLHPVYARA